MPAEKSLSIIKILQVAAASVFAGRAWQHVFWDAPFRELLWDATFLRYFIEKWTSWTWEAYLTDPAVDLAIQKLIVATGVFYTFCGIVVVFVRRLPVFARSFLWVGALSLVFLAFLYTKDHFYHFGQFFEYALQFGAPVFLLTALRPKKIGKPLLFWMKIATGLTFACHGLYAIGYYPTPGYFLEMTMRILGVSQGAAIWFLKIAGILDFVVLLGIFLPDRWAKWIFLYAACWGLATSLARVFGNFYWDFPLDSLHLWVHEAVYRLPHFLVPYALWKIAKTAP